MKAVEERLKGAFEGSEFDGLREHVDVVLSSEGLRIEFGEGLIGDATFASGSAKMTVPMLRAITILGGEIAALPHDVIIEGHTDGVPLQRAGGYSNWELSSDRANAARRALQGQGVAPGRIASVRGLADRYPKISDFPMDPRNRRISVLLPFRATVASAPPADAAIAADTSADTR